MSHTRRPRVIGAVIIISLLVFAAELFIGDALVAYFALWPLGSISVMGERIGFRPWQLVTYSFLHANMAHLFFNMFAVLIFGSELEIWLGARRMLSLYFAAIIAAGIIQLIVSSIGSETFYPTVGASGGVFGLLLAYGMYFPKRKVILLIPPIPMPAWLFVTLYGIVELFLGVTGTLAGIAHFAHLGGMVGAWLVIWHWRRKRPFRMR